MANLSKEAQKDKIRNRIKVEFDRSKYEYRPETIRMDSFREDDFQRVAVYARVSTNDPSQTTSFELQKKYYEQLIAQHEKWTLVDIFADEGKSGTTTVHRDEFNRMIEAALAKRIDLIIVKSVSRFARNIVDCLSYVNMLKERSIGVFFESENIYSLNEENTITLHMMSCLAQNESQTRRRSQTASVNMRFNNGMPSTPPLYGYVMGDNGRLVRDAKTWKICRLIFCLYLLNHSTGEIAAKLSKMNFPTREGNEGWTDGAIVDILRSERYCGDVLTWKTFTVDVTSHKKRKNRGERPQSYYKEWHEAIVSRNDWIAIQHMLDNTKYRCAHLLPALHVIPEGLLKGYVVVNPHWAFKTDEYRNASLSIEGQTPEEKAVYTAKPGEFDLRCFDAVSAALFSTRYTPCLTFQKDAIHFNVQCFSKMPSVAYVELLVHPGKKRLAIRPTIPDNRNAIKWGQRTGKGIKSRPISCKAFISQLFELLEWNETERYGMQGNLYQADGATAMVFRKEDACLMVRQEELEDGDEHRVLNRLGKRIVAVPEHLANGFGRRFYEEFLRDGTVGMDKSLWKLQMKGIPFAAKEQSNLTPREELIAFVREEFGDLLTEGEVQS